MMVFTSFICRPEQNAGFSFLYLPKERFTKHNTRRKEGRNLCRICLTSSALIILLCTSNNLSGPVLFKLLGPMFGFSAEYSNHVCTVHILSTSPFCITLRFGLGYGGVWRIKRRTLYYVYYSGSIGKERAVVLSDTSTLGIVQVHVHTIHC